MGGEPGAKLLVPPAWVPARVGFGVRFSRARILGGALGRPRDGDTEAVALDVLRVVESLLRRRAAVWMRRPQPGTA